MSNKVQDQAAPYTLKRDHKDIHRAIQDCIGPLMIVQDSTGPYKTIQYHQKP